MLALIQAASTDDLRIPDGVEVQKDSTDTGVPIVSFVHGDKKLTLLLWPFILGGERYFVSDVPKRAFDLLKARGLEAYPLVKALRVSQALRLRLKALGLRPILNSSGNPVGVYPPIVICGSSPVDLDGEELDDAEELGDLV